MLDNEKNLPRWFRNRLKKVMEHNDYHEEWYTVAECTPHDLWTPVDLIIREKYNNGCSSAMGFLGLTPKQCEESYCYIRDNQTMLKEMGMYNEKGHNNFGFPLWKNWEIR